jgi:uncharacterized protein (TIGR02001 family)
MLGFASPAAAGANVTATVVSDDRFRGRSVSAGRPAASFDLGYDAANGAYGGVALSVVAARHDGLQPLAAQFYGGYVRRLQAGPSLDLGLTHVNYTEYWNGERSTQYSELYAGVITRRFATHLYYSPNYFGRDNATLYGEVDAAVTPARNWRLSAHLGVLTILNGPRPGDIRPTQYDWRIGLSTMVKGFQLEVAGSGAGPDRDYYDGEQRSRAGLILALKREF